MNDQVQSILRTVLKAGGAVLITKGWTDQAGLEIAVGGVVAIVGIIWSAVHHKNNPTT